MTRPFCLHSRRWLDFVFTNTTKGCPYGYSNEMCKGEDCGCYEMREETAAYRRKAAVLKDLYGKWSEHHE
jgi:hypothetical protein